MSTSVSKQSKTYIIFILDLTNEQMSHWQKEVLQTAGFMLLNWNTYNFPKEGL